MSVTASMPPFPSAKLGMTPIRADPLASWPLRLLPQQPVAVRAEEMRPDPCQLRGGTHGASLSNMELRVQKVFFYDTIEYILFSV
jgi:hypothetical protein